MKPISTPAAPAYPFLSKKKRPGFPDRFFMFAYLTV